MFIELLNTDKSNNLGIFFWSKFDSGNMGY